MPTMSGPFDPWARLTPREREIAELVLDGLSISTVQTHRTHIHRKLGTHSGAQLVASLSCAANELEPAERRELEELRELAPAWAAYALALESERRRIAYVRVVRAGAVPVVEALDHLRALERRGAA